MSITIEKASLLKNRRIEVKIGAFDGLVGTVIKEGEFFITSANQNHIPLPPLGPQHPLTLRADSLYGDDDPIQWPQPFNANFPHYSCIPRLNSRPTDSIMWWEPTRDSLNSVENAPNPVTGLERLPLPQFLILEQKVDALLTRVESYLHVTPAAQIPKPLGPMAQMMKHGLTRLKYVAMSFSQMKFQVRVVQRSWLEIVALLDYMEIYCPRMNAPTDTILVKVPPTANTVGTFTSDLRVAQDHFAAGLPYWLIRPASTFTDENVLVLCDLEPPSSINLYSDLVKCPVLADGRAGTDLKYNAIHRYARNFMKYPDPFNYGITINDLPTTTLASTAVIPPIPRSSGGKRPGHQKRVRARRGKNKERNEQLEGQPEVQRIDRSNLEPTQSPARHFSRFEHIDTPIMPLPIPSWCDALKAVDRNSWHHGLNPSDRRNKRPHDEKYMFPEPAIFGRCGNEVRRSRFFATWANIRDICIYRAFSASSNAVPLSGQEWRDFLFGHLNATYEGAKIQELQRKLRDLFANSLDELDFNFDNFDKLFPDAALPPPSIATSDAQKVLWELSELNFRFELQALDRRASASVNDGDAHERQEMVNNCFPDVPSTIVADVERATRGLGSLDWRERLPVLLRLRTLMQNWLGLKPTPLLLPDLDDLDTYKEEDARIIEEAVARFYTQSFYDFFGRAAIIPTTLPT